MTRTIATKKKSAPKKAAGTVKKVMSKATKKTALSYTDVMKAAIRLKGIANVTPVVSS
jgi:hypothetical protein